MTGKFEKYTLATVCTIILIFCGLFACQIIYLKDEVSTRQETIDMLSNDFDNQSKDIEDIQEEKKELEKENEELNKTLDYYKNQHDEDSDTIDAILENMLALRDDLEWLDKIYIPTYSEYDIEVLCKTLYGEANGCSDTQKAAVVWCVLNRVDYGLGSISEVCMAEGQFAGYAPYHPVTDANYILVVDVLSRWCREYVRGGDVGRVLPKEYLYFYGDGRVNHFTTGVNGAGTEWDWSWGSPY